MHVCEHACECVCMCVCKHLVSVSTGNKSIPLNCINIPHKMYGIIMILGRYYIQQKVDEAVATRVIDV